VKPLTDRPGGASGRVAGRVAAAMAVGVAVVAAAGSWWWAPQVGYRVEAVATPSCPLQSWASQAPASQAPASQGSVGSVRAGTDRALLPLAAMSGPLTATVCRPDRPQTVVHLDAARTAHLAAVLDTPQGGWPPDALLAKRVPAVTATAVVGCPASLVALMRFDYPTGAPVSVWVSGGPLPDGGQCLAVDNGQVRWRVSPAAAVTLTTALDELPKG
jgi:hypothetical protein